MVPDIRIGATYVQRRDALVVGECGIKLPRLEQLLHGRDIAHPGQLHDIILGRLLAVGGEAAHLHLVVELGSGGRGLGRDLEVQWSA